METPREKSSSTESQLKAVRARGNVLVMAGAGTGKTHTLVERCLDCVVREGASLDEILVVTFTEAAAAEMKHRLRTVLENTCNLQLSTSNQFAAEQLALFDAAHIGTLHGFCFKLVREHFYELGLDPQPAVLDEGEARLLADETLEETLQEQYEGRDEFAASVQSLIQTYGGARDEKIRALVLRLHHYAQTRPDAGGWLAQQIHNFSAKESADWQAWLLVAIADWRDEWLPVLENLKARNEKAAELTGIFQRLQSEFSRELTAEVLGQIISTDGNWPAKRKTVLRAPLENLFDEAKFFVSVAAVKNGRDPLAEDWNWVRNQMTALLRLAQNFAARFVARKRDDGVLDFHDLEQFALKLLWDFETEKPTDIAKRWRENLRFVFVDEYQDINAAQDKIIQALSRDERWGETPGEPNLADGKDGSPHRANRFLVGDVKQSIYRFRLADPEIFRAYAHGWCGTNGQTIPLAENFRSRESLLNFVNSLFAPLMREEIGGVNYDDQAKLKFGSPEARMDFSAAKDQSPRAELLLRLKQKPGEVSGEESGDWTDLEESAKEARLLALRLNELKNSGHEIWDVEKKIFRAVEWRDMAVLMRSPSGKAEIFAKQFERAGIPLAVARGGFYDNSEVLDLLSLLQLLDNPLQDVPGIAVLRSPLVGCSLDELAEIRLAGSGHFWFALNQIQNSKLEIGNGLRAKIEKFLERFHRWRKLARQISLSQCLEDVLAETHYADWLKSRPRGAQKHANVEQFLNLAQRFDQFQRQGLFRFLKFIAAQREAGAEPEVAPVADENAVRLTSIHQSKGLEFPVVVVADLAKAFNEQDLRSEIILDGRFGLCPRVQPPRTGGRYPSLPHWLAQRRQRRELRGEELRLLYVAMTRARDTLILSGGIAQKKWDELWTKPAAAAPQAILAAQSFADWIGLWFANQAQNAASGQLSNLHWRIANDAELAVEKAEDGRRKTGLPELDDGIKQKLREILAWNYKFGAAKSRRAKQSVTTLNRAATDELDEESVPIFVERKFSRPSQHNARGRISAAATGTAHHKFLQYFSFESAASLESLAAEARRLEREKVLTADERKSLILENVAAFWNSAPGQKILGQHPEFVKRELAFTTKFGVAELDDILGETSEANLEGEFIVVQGRIDLVVLLPEEIWLVDFKTDQVHGEELAMKIKLYGLQLKLYANALEKIYSRPVTHGWLHFLDARKTVDVKI